MSQRRQIRRRRVDLLSPPGRFPPRTARRSKRAPRFDARANPEIALLAVLAASQDGEMAWIDREAEPLLRLPGQSPEQIVGSLDGEAAVLALKMGVCVGRKLVSRRSVAQVRVHEHANSLELLQVAINGRQMDVGCPTLHDGGHLFRCHVPLCPKQRLQQNATCCSCPATVGAKENQNLVDGGGNRRRGNRWGKRLTHSYMIGPSRWKAI